MMRGGSIARCLVPASLIVMVLFFYVPVDAQQHDLTVRVVDPSGRPLERAEVILTRDVETYRFVTNSTGHAFFTGLSAGEYTVRVRLNRAVVAEGVLRIPDTSYMDLTAQISDVRIRLVDLGHRPAPSVEVRLTSRTRVAEFSGVTNEAGELSFTRVPYTSLRDVGGYSLRVAIGGLTVFSADNVSVDKPVHELEYRLPLLTLNITTVNLEGEPVDKTEIQLSGGNYTRTLRVDAGTAEARLIPSSELGSIGPYTINVTYTLGGVEYTVHSTKRSLYSSMQLDLILELAKLEVTVLDEEGKPLKDVVVSLSNNRAKNFSKTRTDEAGKATFTNMPLSHGVSQAGEYTVQAYRDGRMMAEKRVELVSSRASVTLRIERMGVELLLRDYGGSPLAGYEVTLVDPNTGEKYLGSTDASGRISLRIFPGTHEVQVSRGGKIVYRDVLDIGERVLTLDIERINFPLTLRVVDAFGGELRSAEILVRLGGEEIYRGPAALPLRLVIPHSGFLVVDIKSSGILLHRESFIVDSASEKVVRLGAYAEIFGILTPLELLASMIAVSASSLMIAVGAYTLYRGSRKRRLITR